MSMHLPSVQNLEPRTGSVMSKLHGIACTALLTVVLVCAGMQAQAQTSSCGPGLAGSPCVAGQVAGMDSSGGIAQGAGNPVNIITGNKYQQEIDMAPLPGVLGLELVRHYNSQHATPGMPLQGIGHGWRFSYDTRIYLVGETLQVIQADGARIIFARSAWSRTLCTSVDAANGLVRIVPQPGYQEYRWLWPNGRELSFDRNGRLDRIAEPSGHVLTIERFDDGRLASVKDPQGRTMYFHYLQRKHDKPGRYRGVQSVDTPVGRFLFDYGDAQGAALDEHGRSRARLEAVHLPTRYDPTQPRPPTRLGDTPGTTSVSTIRRVYHYEDLRFPTLLTGITLDGAGSDSRALRERIATWAYDRNGLAVLSVKGAPAQKGADGKPVPGTGVEQLSFERSEPGQTRLINSLGQVTVYRHAIVAGAFRLLEARGAGCASCGPVNVRYRYDKYGRLKEVIRLDDAGMPLDGRRLGLDALGRPYAFLRVSYRNGRESAAALVLRQQFPYPGLPYGWPDARAPLPHFGPKRIATDSVVPGKTHEINIDYNPRHQPVTVSEKGYNPVDGSEITRSTRYRYAEIYGHSLLAEVDGPLPNGPAGTPADSDITHYEWDKRGATIVAITLPGGRKTALEHDPTTGRLTRMVQDDGAVTTMAYNPDGTLAQTSEARPGQDSATIRSLLYDAHGHQTGSGAGVPGQAGWRPELLSAFDSAGRPSWTAQASGMLAQWAYDTEGRLIEQAMGSGHIRRAWRYSYDARGRIIDATDPAGGMMQAAYPADIAKPNAAPATAGQVRQVRDDFGRNVASISPDSGATTRSYDEADRMVASTDAAGNHAHYAYDLAGRILQQDIVDAGATRPMTTRWGYEGQRLVALDHPTQDERYGYDERGLLETKTVARRDESGAVLSSVTRYSYDSQGRLTGASLPDGSMLLYQRDGQGQVNELQRSRIQTTWMRWLLPVQVLARDIERDLAGLSRYITGNRIEARYQRSREGVLARMVYRPVDAPLARRMNEKAASRLPGALGLPPDLQALLDQRFLWDTRGNLLLRQAPPGDAQTTLVTGYAYDRHDRLLVAAHAQWASRYFHDARGNRLLSQQGMISQAELQAGTKASQYQSGSNRWLGDTAMGKPIFSNSYDATGQPINIGDRRYRWDAIGRLLDISDNSNKVIASYRYNHRGERIAKEVGGKRTGYLYQEGELAAETDVSGNIKREYVWLAGQPLAVIDFAAGHAPGGETGWSQAAADLVTVFRAWFGSPERITWLHANHLGAPEVGTDASGAVTWRAAYEPFGAAAISAAGADGFNLNLRLPGQYLDEESGLHYNRHRYYDPTTGRYLTPDPLGMPDGPNSYIYVRGNPLRYVDPAGLILFAFDGTGNTNDEEWLSKNGSSLSNVWQFRQLYEEGNRRYISGVGTVYRDDKYGDIKPTDYVPSLVPLSAQTADMGGNYSGPARMDRMLQYFKDEAELFADDSSAMDVDIIGFSRGAAQARAFANRLVASTRDDWYQYQTKDGDGKAVTRCQKLNFRFMGLFDTVLSTNKSGLMYQLAVPDTFTYVAQAIALNEYRGSAVHPYLSVGAFPGESIMPGAYSPVEQPGKTRIERGFIGAHADIGGGFAENEKELAQVALAWMVMQAEAAGVKMKPSPLLTIANPVIHDKSGSILTGAPGPTAEDRKVNYSRNGSTKQREMTFSSGMSWVDTQQFINYLPENDPLRPSFITGTVDMQAYLGWLKNNGYDINLTTNTP